MPPLAIDLKRSRQSFHTPAAKRLMQRVAGWRNAGELLWRDPVNDTESQDRCDFSNCAPAVKQRREFFQATFSANNCRLIVSSVTNEIFSASGLTPPITRL